MDKENKAYMIGLVTFYKEMGFNYGSVLQAFATQHFLKENGFKCELINYLPYSNNINNLIKKLLQKIYLLFYNKKVLAKWNKMRKWIKKNTKESKRIIAYAQLEKYSRKYDAVICGSDQIWNNYKNIANPFFYLQFVPKEKRIAYAPSIGRNFIDERVKETFKKFVSEIKYISIREQQGAEIIKDLLGRDVPVVIDPIFLLGKEQWEKEIKSKNIEKNPYIFVYFLSKNNEYFEEVKKFAEKNNLKIITTPMLYDKDDTAVIADAWDFLNLIKNAKYVATDSFHGLAFSIKFEKKFIVYKRFKDGTKETQNSRIYNLLNELDLNSRLKTNNNSISEILNQNINYEMTNEKLDKLVNNSKSYLLTALNNVLQVKKG